MSARGGERGCCQEDQLQNCKHSNCGPVIKLDRANVGFRYCSQKSIRRGSFVPCEFKSFPFTFFSVIIENNMGIPQHL